MIANWLAIALLLRVSDAARAGAADSAREKQVAR
jgi:hypothetical protein